MTYFVVGVVVFVPRGDELGKREDGVVELSLFILDGQYRYCVWVKDEDSLPPLLGLELLRRTAVSC